jgi:predicted Zn-dependent peptidase
MKIIEKKLPNGLRIVMVPQADAATVTTLILVGTGSKYESKKDNGLSHFLEHMCFKGTERHPTAQSIAERFDNVGAIYNAFTSQEYTGYYAKGSPEHAGTFIEVLGDIYVHSTLPEQEIEKEKGVIVEEINMNEDSTHHKVWDVLLELVYGDQAMGRTVSGSKQNVLSFTRKDFLQYRSKHYTAHNTIVVVAGNFDAALVQKQVKTAFASINTTKPAAYKKVADAQSKPQIAIFEKKTDQAHIVMAFRSIPLDHPDSAVVSLLSTVLGGGMSSRLFLKLREEMGAAYYVRAEQDSFADHGMFTVSAGIDKTRLQEIIESIVAILKDLKTRPISAQELQKVKEYSIGMVRLGLESSDSVAGFYGAQILLKGKYKTPEQLTRDYRAVTAADIQRVAKKILVEKHANLAMLGPFNQKKLSTKIFQGL